MSPQQLRRWLEAAVEPAAARAVRAHGARGPVQVQAAWIELTQRDSAGEQAASGAATLGQPHGSGRRGVGVRTEKTTRGATTRNAQRRERPVVWLVRGSDHWLHLLHDNLDATMQAAKLRPP